MEDNHLDKRVLHVEGKIFMEQYLQAVIANRKSDFVSLYLELDELVVNNIQCWLGKQKLQEVFLDIAQTLQKKEKLVYLTSEFPLDESEGFDPRLKNLTKDFIC